MGTKGARTGLFALRRHHHDQLPGFPSTMGAPFMDYIVVTNVVAAGLARHYREKIAYVGPIGS